MNNEQQTDNAVHTEPSLSDMSLAEYRAQREGTHAEAALEKKESATPAAGSEELEEHEETAKESQESDGDESAEKKPAKKGGFQRKIDKLSEENRRLSEQLAQRNAAKPEGEKKDKPAAVVEFKAPKPKLEDFESIETFAEALTDWKADEREWKREQASAHAKAQEEAQKTLNTWKSREAEAKKAHADYDEVLDSANDIKLSPAHQRIFLESEAGAEIAYDLASDPAELKKFAAMSPLAAAKYFGKLEAAYSSEETPEPETKVSKAPKPIRPLGAGKASAAGSLDLKNVSLAQYRKAREAGKI